MDVFLRHYLKAPLKLYYPHNQVAWLAKMNQVGEKTMKGL